MVNEGGGSWCGRRRIMAQSRRTVRAMGCEVELRDSLADADLHRAAPAQRGDHPRSNQRAIQPRPPQRRVVRDCETVDTATDDEEIEEFGAEPVEVTDHAWAAREEGIRGL